MRRLRLLGLGLVLVLQLPATAANIEVNATCTLIDAIAAANNDDDAGGLCPPGGSGNDVLQLTGDIELTTVEDTSFGDTGTPSVTSNIQIDGGGFEISRPATAPGFRHFVVEFGGVLTLSSVTVSGGVATSHGSFYGPAGGAVYSDYGTVRLVNTTVRDNSARNGGAIFGNFGTVALFDSTVEANYASGRGGGIGSYNAMVSGTNSTFSGNFAGVYGGAVFSGYGADLTLVSSTIAANTAPFGGGGISNYGSFGNAPTLVGSALGYNDGGNYGGNCGVYFVHDDGGNVDNDGSCGVSGFLSGLDPTLADNGGPTRTHALVVGSSAIDNAGACGLLGDQREFLRDASCDSGSVEFGAAPTGGSPIGLRVQRVTCKNVTTGQTVLIAQPEGSFDCEGAGLTVNPGDDVRLDIGGRSSEADFGATAIGVSGLRVRCLNRTTSQQVQFQPSATHSWSCADEGLTYGPTDRLQQTVLGVAN